MRGSIFERFTLLNVLIALAALIPLVAFGLYAIQVASNHLVRETAEKLQRSVLDDADKIKRAFDLVQSDLPILSQLSEMRELVRAKVGTNPREIELAEKVVEHTFLTFSNNRKMYSQIRYIDEHGREVVRVDYGETHPPQIIPYERLQEQRQRDYFAETMTLGPGQVYVSPLSLNQERGQIEVPYRPVIRYATPLFDDAGHRRGIVIINLLVGPLLEALYQEAKAARKVVYAVDQEGFYLLHPDPAKQWGGPRHLNTGERIQRDFPTLAVQILSRHAVATVMGEQVITTQPLALSSSHSGPSLVIVELIPTSVVLAAITNFRLYLLILLVGVGTVAAVGAVLIGEKLTRPIVALEKAATQIQQGDLGARVKAGGSHEIAALGDAFNAMAEGLTQASSQIERQLRELTAMNRIGTAVSGTLSLNEILDQALDATLLGLGVEAGEIFLLDEEQGEVVLVRHRGLAQEAFQQISRFKLGEGFPGRVALSGEVLTTADLSKDPRFLRKQVIEVGFNTLAAIPLKAAGKVVGTLDVATRAPHSFPNGDFPFLITIGATIGMAVANARLFEEQRVAATQLGAKVEELERMQARLLEAERLRAMGQMAAGVAHDFNNALMGILGQAQLMRLVLERGPVAAALQGVEGGTRLLECLERQHQAAQDAAETIRKIREATRPRNTEAFGPVSPSRVVEQVLAVSRPRWKDQAEAAGARIMVQTALAETPPVLGHAAELREALTNLLFNALDAMPQGGTITITTRHIADDEVEEAHVPEPGTWIPEPGTQRVREWVELIVTDTGVGMPPAVQARLFEPFFTTKGMRGTGLGLSMVYGIVSRHEGEITVQSAEGQGTTITMRLPVAKVATTEVVPPPAAPPPITRPLVLLVIDDEPLLAQTLADLLRILGHEAVIATSGEDGLTRLAAEHFDLVLTDLGMPTMSGWEVAQAVKARWPQLPVILVTGWGDAVERDRLDGTGVDLILAKPYTVAQLTHALTQAVALTSRGRNEPIGEGATPLSRPIPPASLS